MEYRAKRRMGNIVLPFELGITSIIAVKSRYGGLVILYPHKWDQLYRKLSEDGRDFLNGRSREFNVTWNSTGSSIIHTDREFYSYLGKDQLRAVRYGSRIKLQSIKRHQTAA